MKSTFLSFLAIVSLLGFAHAHCGGCGTGDAKEHKHEKKECCGECGGKEKASCDKKDCDWTAKFKKADTDGNGSLSLEEFLAMAEAKKSKKKECCGSCS